MQKLADDWLPKPRHTVRDSTNNGTIQVILTTRENRRFDSPNWCADRRLGLVERPLPPHCPVARATALVRSISCRVAERELPRAPRTDPYVHLDAYGSYLGCLTASR
jgi:hypothetical protein